MIIGAVQVFELLQQNCFIMEKVSARDNRGQFKLSDHFNKTALFLRKFQFVIIGAVQVFESLQQYCFIFEKISARDNRGSLSFFERT